MKSGENMEKGRSEGFFAQFGGQFVPVELKSTVEEVALAYAEAKKDVYFMDEFKGLLLEYANRPSMLYYAKNLSEKLGGAKIYLKREDLNHTGAHKVNNVLGQALLAKRMGKIRLIAETGAGQHGVATATAAVLLGLECEIYMGSEDIQRQALNVFRMELLGAKVHAVSRGTKTLKDAVDAALEAWVERPNDTYYLLGSAVGPHPYPEMVRDFQKVIGQEAKEQMLQAEGRLPDLVIACVGGGSNAIGIFHEFVPHKEVQLIGVEAGGLGLDTVDNAAALSLGRPATFHGMHTYFNLDINDQIAPVYSLSAGLDYPGVGPEHAYLKEINRAQYLAATDQEAVAAFLELAQSEGIIPAIESSHALAEALKRAPKMSKGEIILVNLSGRGDKDVAMIARYLGRDDLDDAQLF
ncbi:MAG: tryptophan synthase subunit beta [Firmicutes bacterium]|jgi:tryptophan synthase beta chain|nr:tryptophan synthase subunit beta [Bacillota bacterium]